MGMGMDGKVERERKWREHVGGWQKSGLSQAGYCRQHGLTQNDFSWWKRELARRVVAAAPAFVAVQMASPRTAALGFELELRGGRLLRFDAHVDPVALNAVVRVLEAQAVPC